tara:strand:- start:2191 stop:2415 length:225 start_codon:yes stop_codon:yes gene_type:complete
MKIGDLVKYKNPTGFGGQDRTSLIGVIADVYKGEGEIAVNRLYQVYVRWNKGLSDDSYRQWWVYVDDVHVVSES